MLLARHEEINKWLAEHPLVLGGLFLVLGLALLGFGINDLVTGKSRTKWGAEIQGGMATLSGVVRVIGGMGSIVFGAYKLIEGLL